METRGAGRVFKGAAAASGALSVDRTPNSVDAEMTKMDVPSLSGLKDLYTQ